MRRFVIAASVALLAAVSFGPGIGSPSAASHDDPTRTSFLVVGDFGRANDAQWSAAEAMVDFCDSTDCDFVISTGDNIYDAGTVTAYDPAFVLKFEQPYADLGLPWYLSLGNHDNALGVLMAQGDSQVAYTYRTDRLSDMWNMPARWYTHQTDHADFFAIDGDTIHAGLLGLMDPTQQAAEQKAFHRQALAGSTAPWKIAFGHYPFISNGEGHGDAGAGFGGAFSEVFCDEVDLYLAGHSHTLQWLYPDPDCGRTQFVISGAASGPAPVEDVHDSHFQAGGVVGFAHISLDDDDMVVTFVDEHGTVLHRQAMTKAELDSHPPGRDVTNPGA